MYATARGAAEYTPPIGTARALTDMPSNQFPGIWALQCAKQTHACCQRCSTSAHEYVYPECGNSSSVIRSCHTWRSDFWSTHELGWHVERAHARSSRSKQAHASPCSPCESMVVHATPCKSGQALTTPCKSMQIHAGSMQKSNSTNVGIVDNRAQ